MATLKQEIEAAQSAYHTAGTASVMSPTVPGKKKEIRTNKEMTNYTRTLISLKLNQLKFAAASIWKLQSLFTKAKGKDQVLLLPSRELIDRKQLTKLKQAFRVTIDEIKSNLSELTKRHRKAALPGVEAVSGSNALTFVDAAMVAYLNGSAGGVLAVPLRNLRAELAGIAAKPPKKAKGVEIRGANLLAELNVAVGAIVNLELGEDQSLGTVLSTLFSRESTGLPAAVSRYVLITAPHLIKYYRKLRGDASVELRLPLPTGKSVRPYYLVTEEFNPIRGTIERLQNGATGDTAIADAQRLGGGKIPPVISQGGQLYYSLTAVQRFNAPHTAMKSITGSNAGAVVAGSGGATNEQINIRILDAPQAEWPGLWQQISKDSSRADILETARIIIKLFKAVYQALKFAN